MYIADDAKRTLEAWICNSRNDRETSKVHDKVGPRDKVCAWRRESS